MFHRADRKDARDNVDSHCNDNNCISAFVRLVEPGGPVGLMVESSVRQGPGVGSIPVQNNIKAKDISFGGGLHIFLPYCSSASPYRAIWCNLDVHNMPAFASAPDSSSLI